MREERLRGIAEATLALEALHALLPAAFPRDPRQVKPLMPGITAQIAAINGWSSGYASGVLHEWKRRVAYCAAVLRGTHFYDLDGQKTGIVIDEAAREVVRKVGNTAAG